MNIVSCSDDDFRQYLSEHTFALISFYTEWCGTCRLFYPFFIELSEDERYEDVLFMDVNIESSTRIKSEYSIDVVPAYALFKEGELLDKVFPSREEDIDKLIVKMESLINA